MDFSLLVPGKATLVAPSGNIKTTTPAYTWNADPDSTSYYLWVNDSKGTRILQWYKAGDAGCSEGKGTCSVTPQIPLFGGPAKWWVQTSNANGYGPWSDGLVFSVGLPGQVTLVSPSGKTVTNKPAYTWNADPDTTWYYLWVDDSKGTKIRQWVKAADAGCGAGTGTCSVTPGTALEAGSAKWWVQTYNANGYGPWSEGLAFSVALPGKVTLISPNGNITVHTPSFSWTADPDTTWYYLYVNDSNGLRIKQWYKAADAGCPEGVGSCTVSPGVALAAGAGKWWVQTYNASGYGPWSDAMNFNVGTIYDGKWTLTGSLKIERADHTVTPLPYGKVLAAGGMGYSGLPLVCSDVYNPDTWKWAETGNLNFERFLHSATSLPDGKVLVTGGRGVEFNTIPSTEIYDPATGKWTQTGDLNVAREEHTTTVLANGKVLVAGGGTLQGGWMTDSKSAELYDPAAGKWTMTGNLKVTRKEHTATLLPNGKVLVAGGWAGPNAVSSNTAELYDPATGQWTQTGNLNSARIEHSATLLPNGKVLVAGGWLLTAGGAMSHLKSSELYDPATGLWTLTGDLNQKRESHTATLLNTGEVLVAGGGSSNTSAGNLKSSELYNPAKGTWTPTGDLNTERSKHGSSLLEDGRVLAVGGYSKDDTLTSAEIYER